MLVARGFPADEVEAVLGAREPDALDDPHDAWVRARRCTASVARRPKTSRRLAVAFKRAKNILEQARPAAAVDPALFEADAERELFAAMRASARTDGGYEERLRALAGLRAPVDRFFDDVLVMAEDATSARTASAFSQSLSLFYRIADISKLGG